MKRIRMKYNLQNKHQKRWITVVSVL